MIYKQKQFKLISLVEVYELTHFFDVAYIHDINIYIKCFKSKVQKKENYPEM